jgi:glucose/mannose-6-phosphate isomerase
MSLDDANRICKIDQSDMFGIMERTPSRLSPPVDAVSTCHDDFGAFENVVFGGMGGSGIIGEVLSDYSREWAEMPISICRALRIPRFVGKRTLFVAISYSGETPETLNQLGQARSAGARTIAITSGGRLLSLAKDTGMAYLRVPSGLLPRVALPELTAAALFAMGSAKLIPDPSKLLLEAARSLNDLIMKVKTAVPSLQNNAKQMAQALVDRLPLIIGNETHASVLRRFKNELNENSKMPAVCCTIPEGYHDDIEGLKALGQLARPQPILLRTKNEIEGQNRTREQLALLLSDLGFPPVLEFKGNGDDELSQLLTAITFADYVSAYLAILRGVDPSELSVIPSFREAMRGK